MSKFPVDIFCLNELYKNEIEKAVEISNSLQDEFAFSMASATFVNKFRLLNFDKIDGEEFLNRSEKIRKDLNGYFPHIIFITDSPISGGNWSNLFSYNFWEDGLTIMTSDRVEELIIPKGKMIPYFLYYFAQTALKFMIKREGLSNHLGESEKGCVFDFMKNKTDILKSMRPNSICDKCKRDLLSLSPSPSENMLAAIDLLLAESGRTLNSQPNSITKPKKRIFIGSSVEGLDIARKIKSGLKYDAHVDTWADGIFDEPGKAYIEVLEGILSDYEYSIFVFNPDDKVYSRGKMQDIPRDNVIFEYGLFMGKHSRKNTFFIIPRGGDVKIMSDLLGITCLDYDPTNPNLQSAVSDACDQIRNLLN